MEWDLYIWTASLHNDFINVLSIIPSPLNLKSILKFIEFFYNLGIKRLPLQIFDLKEFAWNLRSHKLLYGNLFILGVNLGPQTGL